MRRSISERLIRRAGSATGSGVHSAALRIATFVAVPLLLTSVALLACLVPARAAARLDPVDVLRSE